MRTTLIVFVLLIFVQSTFAQSITQVQWAELKEEIKSLKMRVEKLEKPGGLKIEDFKNTKLNKGQGNTGAPPEQSLTPEQMKQLEEATKLIQKNEQEQKKFLEQLEHEN